MGLTAAQSRGARGLLSMTQAELADSSGISLRTIAHFESGGREPVPKNLAAIRRALEEAGVQFIDENGGGAGVRFAKRKARAR